jgi:hypothetical protein
MYEKTERDALCTLREGSGVLVPEKRVLIRIFASVLKRGNEGSLLQIETAPLCNICVAPEIKNVIKIK